MKLAEKPILIHKTQTINIWLKIGTAIVSAGLLCALFFGRGAGYDSRASVSVRFDREIPKLMRQYSVPGVAIALIQDGKLVWLNAYGYADLEKKQPMRIDSVFRVESISKSLTAWGVMKLVEQGRIDLDQPVQTYLRDWTLPKSEYPLEKITVRRLLSNSAGLPLGAIGDEYSPLSPMPSLWEVLNEEIKPFDEAGLKFSYSNAGYHLLELLIEQVSGRNFAEYMQDEILAPLGMENASFTWDEKFRPLVPTGYDLNRQPVPIYVYPAKASGGLFATIQDIANFICAGVAEPYRQSDSVLSKQSISEIYTPQIEISGVYRVVADDYGFGHFIENLPNGQRAVWHGGQGHGWMTHFHLIPETGDGIVILTNSQRSWPVMAKILSIWADWNGVGSVKMGRITYATTAFQILIGMVLLTALWNFYRLFRGWMGKKYKFAPLSRDFFFRRFLQAFLGIDILAGLVWSTAQPYLMVSSIFPASVGWAGFALLMLAFALILSAFFIRKDTINRI